MYNITLNQHTIIIETCLLHFLLKVTTHKCRSVVQISHDHVYRQENAIEQSIYYNGYNNYCVSNKAIVPQESSYQYWPAATGQLVEYGEYMVDLISEEALEGFTIRKISILEQKVRNESSPCSLCLMVINLCDRARRPTR